MNHIKVTLLEMNSHSNPTENLDSILLDGMKDLFHIIIIYLYSFQILLHPDQPMKILII
jgi:hypothetical protein